jgi:hypothetical protein
MAVTGEYEISGEEDERLETLPGGKCAAAGNVACVRGGGESGGVDRVYRTGSKAGGEDKGDGMEGEPIELGEVLARLVEVEPRKEWTELFIARAIADRVELLREPGDKCKLVRGWAVRKEIR